MNTANPIDEARLGIMLNELRLPTIKTLWPQFAEAADREGWPAARACRATTMAPKPAAAPSISPKRCRNLKTKFIVSSITASLHSRGWWRRGGPASSGDCSRP